MFSWFNGRNSHEYEGGKVVWQKLYHRNAAPGGWLGDGAKVRRSLEREKHCEGEQACWWSAIVEESKDVLLCDYSGHTSEMEECV